LSPFFAISAKMSPKGEALLIYIRELSPTAIRMSLRWSWFLALLHGSAVFAWFGAWSVKHKLQTCANSSRFEQNRCGLCVDSPRTLRLINVLVVY